jgi:alpha-beta hydrolase superfamily lysophospholipase
VWWCGGGVVEVSWAVSVRWWWVVEDLAMLGMTMMLVRPRKHGLANRWSIETKPTF